MWRSDQLQTWGGCGPWKDVHEVKNNIIKFGFIMEENEDKIITLIIKNNDIKKLLSEAKENIDKHLKDYSLYLTLYEDMEGFETLNIIIYCDININDLIKIESSIFDEWFKKWYIKLDGKITLRSYPINNSFKCQNELELNDKCQKQCEHCEQYYEPIK